MNKSIAWLLLVLSPLSASCVAMVSLAERSDGGPDDAPVVDRLAMDLPVSGDRPDNGPAAPDAPTPDVNLPYCPAEFDYDSPTTPALRYPRASVVLLPGAMLPDAGTTFEFTGTWAGTRRQEAPISLGCYPSHTRPECRVDTVIGVQQAGGALQEFVVTTPAEDLSALTVGMPVTLRGTARPWDGPSSFWFPSELVIRRSTDDALMLVLGTWSGMPGNLDVPTVVGSAVCHSRPEPVCRRTLYAFSMQFGLGAAAQTLAPGQQAMVNHGGVTYLCRNWLHSQRIWGNGPECSDHLAPVTSLEIVRQL